MGKNGGGHLWKRMVQDWISDIKEKEMKFTAKAVIQVEVEVEAGTDMDVWTKKFSPADVSNVKIIHIDVEHVEEIKGV